MSKKMVILSALLAVSLLAMPAAGCAKELTLTVWEPLDGATFTDSPVAIRGTVSDSKATVTINDVVVYPDKKGGFSTTVEPFEGENAINIVASRGKRIATHYVTITYSP